MENVLSFDGRNDYVDIPAAIPKGNQITISFWCFGGDSQPRENVTFSGYGVLMVNGDIIIDHNIFTAITGPESMIGLYTSGKVETKATHTSIAAQNGMTPMKISFMGTPSAMPLTTKTLSPRGGLIRLISRTTTKSAPNQIGS